MSNLIFDLVIEDGFWGISDCSFRDTLEYYKDSIDKEINTNEELNNYIKKWIENHKFANLDNSLYDYDLEKGYAIREAVYTIDNKYYRIRYYTDPYDGCELVEGPVEVYPVTTTITKYIEKK